MHAANEHENTYDHIATHDQLHSKSFEGPCLMKT